MGSLSGVGIALCLVFGCILLILVAAELYYLLWWRNRQQQNPNSNTNFCPLPFLKNPSGKTPQIPTKPQDEHDTEMGFRPKEMGAIKTHCVNNEEGVETELMRAHNLTGPPRFLFTIKEESKEDMESDDGNNNRSRVGSRLSDLIFAMDGTPFLTPLSSPTLRAAAAANPSMDSFRINPLFEDEYYLERLRSSPPPKLQFLKDAEDKLLKRLEAERKRGLDLDVDFGVTKSGEEDGGKNGSFLAFINKGQAAASAQVLPLC